MPDRVGVTLRLADWVTLDELVCDGVLDVLEDCNWDCVWVGVMVKLPDWVTLEEPVSEGVRDKLED